MENFDVKFMEIISKIGILSPNQTQLDFFNSLAHHHQKNLIFHAQNGAGKTIAYSLFILKELICSRGLKKALIFVPSRELAFQVCNFMNMVINKFPESNVITKLLIGGLSVNDDKNGVQNLRPNLIVGTAGRILHLVKCEMLNLDGFDFLVFDEYDKLFENKEFIHILKLLKRSRKNWLGKCTILAFSATPGTLKIKKLGRVIHPYKICATQSKINELMPKNNPLENKPSSLTAENALASQKMDINIFTLRQYFFTLESRMKTNEEITKIVKNILTKLSFKKCIIFYNDKVRGDELWQDLHDSISVGEIIYFHSELLQSQRLKLFHKFKHCAVKIAVTTDVLSRGLDFDNIDVVINFDVPFNIETYFHRIGRCGRHGNFGVSFLFVTEKNKGFFLENANYLVNLEEIKKFDLENTLKNVGSFISGKEASFLKVNSCEEPYNLQNWKEKEESMEEKRDFNYIESLKIEENIIETEKVGNFEFEKVKNENEVDPEHDFLHCKKCFNTLKTLESTNLLKFSIASDFKF